VAGHVHASQQSIAQTDFSCELALLVVRVDFRVPLFRTCFFQILCADRLQEERILWQETVSPLLVVDVLVEDHELSASHSARCAVVVIEVWREVQERNVGDVGREPDSRDLRGRNQAERRGVTPRRVADPQMSSGDEAVEIRPHFFVRMRDDELLKGVLLRDRRSRRLPRFDVLAWRHHDCDEERARHEAHEHDTQIVDVLWVPGSLELPLIVQALCERRAGDFDGLVILGLIVQGNTKHGEVLGHQVTQALLGLQLKFHCPMAISLIDPCATLEHAQGKAQATARKAVRACLETVELLWSFS